MKKYGKKGTRKFNRRPHKAGGSKVSGYASSKKLVSQAKRGMGVTPYGVKSEPFPRVLLIKCRYGTNSTLTTGLADDAAYHTYGASTIYDPYRGAGGRTVVGHSNLAAIYDQYWVMGCKVSVKFFDVSSDGWVVGVRLRINGNDGVSGETLEALTERPLTYMAGVSNTGQQAKTFKFYIKPWTLVGCSKLEYMANSSAYSSFISGNPSTVDNCVFDVFAINPTETGSVKYQIRIDYYTKIFSRKGLFSTGFA